MKDKWRPIAALSDTELAAVKAETRRLSRLVHLRRVVKRCLPWWSRLLGRRLAQKIYNLLRLRDL